MSRVVVFKDPQALHELRTLLFGSFEEQKRGIALCKAYEVRGPLPPSVHSTCLLLSAIHGDVPSSDLYVTRQAYSMALIRFVNEILDAAQNSRSVIPLYALAAEANLPAAFVELRHAATHESLPSIYILRDMAQRAVSWLHDEYWVHQTVETPRATPGSETAEEDIKELFREWRRYKRSNGSNTSIDIDGIVAKIRSEFEQNEPELLDIVLNRNILVPAGTGPIKSRSTVVAMWYPLFALLGNRFCTVLAGRVITQLSLREWPPMPSENRKYSMLETWAEKLAEYLDSSSLKLTTAAPRPWNAQIIARYAVSHGSPEQYKIAEEMASITGVTLDIEYKHPEKASVWREVSGWSPRPIGTL